VKKYGVSIGRKKKRGGGLFSDDVVLIAPSAKKKILEKIIKKRYINRLILNETTFGIEKCATLVIKTKELPISSKL